MEYLPVLYGLLLYILYVIMPLIPSVIIYKLFPETTVGASGILGNLKINATGAFAAYIITVILGHFIIKQNLDFIDQIKSTTWEITSKVKFVDSEGKVCSNLSDEEIRNKLEIKTTPDYTTKGSSAIVFMAYAKGNLPKVTFSYPGFESKMIDLDIEKVERNFSERKINLGTIELIKQDQDYKPELFNTDSIQSLPIPFGGPPTN